MFIKRLYATPDGWAPIRNKRMPNGLLPVPGKPENDLLNPPPLRAVELFHTGIKEPQNFSDRMVAELIGTGIMSFDDTGALLFKVEHEGKPLTLRYRVLRVPGSYCLHCGENLHDETVNDGAPSRAHVAEKHAGAAAIPGHPAGYERIHAYECELDAEQHAALCHERWDAKKKGRA